jgi:hypothetical protein
VGGGATASATTNGSTIQQVLGAAGSANVSATWNTSTATSFEIGANNNNNGAVTVTGFGGTLAGISGAGTLTVGNGASPTTLTMSINSGGSTQSALTVLNGSTLDITNNHFVINYPKGSDPIATIRQYIDSGYDGGTWLGTGIVSSTIRTGEANYGVGYADSADPGNPAALASNQIEIKFTLLGDANLDGKVNGIDFAILAANLNQSVTRWDQGDFNYDGRVNGIDFTEMANNFDEGASEADIVALDAFAAENGLMADVPEPAAMAIAALGLAGTMGRRRRRR